jgi:excisionase family DNA binding protein
MSSNLNIQKICQLCGKEFIAKTTVTRYCGIVCRKRIVQINARNLKIEANNKETKAIKAKPIEQLKEREFLTVTQVSKLIGCSRQNIYKMINSGKLKATNILEKKTIIKRSNIDKLFEPAEAPVINTVIEPIQIDIAECYTLIEIQNKFGVSERAVSEIVKRNGITKIKNGLYSYVPKLSIDKIFKTNNLQHGSN